MKKNTNVIYIVNKIIFKGYKTFKHIISWKNRRVGKSTLIISFQKNNETGEPDKYIHYIWYCTIGQRLEDVEKKAIE